VEWLSAIALGALTLFFLTMSWRKWPDPLVDFGKELYLPWRLSQGALMYRDVDDYYGPLSQHINAAIFAMFGSGLIVLVIFNLLIFAAIVIALYFLCRRAWGPFAALVSCAIFVSVFGFGQYVGIGNYNYATPYSHESTHGLLVCLLLVHAISRWLQSPAWANALWVGGLFGLTAVLKLEILFAAGLVCIAGIVIGWSARGLTSASEALAGLAGAALPTLLFALYFSFRVPWNVALSMACRAWLNAAHASDPIQQSFLGFDRFGENLIGHVVATLFAIAAIGGICALAWLADRAASLPGRAIAAGLAVSGMIAIGFYAIHWRNVGRCLLGLMLVYMIAGAVPILRKVKGARISVTVALRFLLALLAVGMLARMALNGRIYHYGYYQAALAAVLIPAVLLGELPARLHFGRWGKGTAIAGALCLLFPGVIILAGQSFKMLSLRTYAVSEGRDRFYTFPPKIDPRGVLVDEASKRLRQAASGQTLLVLPDGAMINYLARMPNSVAPFEYYTPEVAGLHEGILVEELRRHPPDWVAIVSRDLRESGIQRYGAEPGKGQEIMQWVFENYQPKASLGGDPLDFQQAGFILLRHTHRPTANTATK
jgi:hypothetical protein